LKSGEKFRSCSLTRSSIIDTAKSSGSFSDPLVRISPDFPRESDSDNFPRGKYFQYKEGCGDRGGGIEEWWVQLLKAANAEGSIGGGEEGERAYLRNVTHVLAEFARVCRTVSRVLVKR